MMMKTVGVVLVQMFAQILQGQQRIACVALQWSTGSPIRLE